MPHVPKTLRRGPFRYLADGDVWHSVIVTVLVCALTGGLLYVFYLVRVWRIATTAACVPDDDRMLLVFGRRLNSDGSPEADYTARLRRTLDILATKHAGKIMLLGGASGSSISEAEAGLRWLRARGLPASIEVVLEQASNDSLENLRHARSLLGEPLPPVALISSRYHLARCLALAAALGFPAQACAAEDHLRVDFRIIRRIALEAGYLMWLQVGTTWSRIIGNERMLTRVT